MAQLDLDERQTKRDGIILTVETEKKRLWEIRSRSINPNLNNNKILRLSKTIKGSMFVNPRNNKRTSGNMYETRQEIEKKKTIDDMLMAASSRTRMMIIGLTTRARRLRRASRSRSESRRDERIRIWDIPDVRRLYV